MGTVSFTVIWMRRDDLHGVVLEQEESLHLRTAMSLARQVSTSPSFLFGQLLAPDGLVVANFAAGCIVFNDEQHIHKPWWGEISPYCEGKFSTL